MSEQPTQPDATDAAAHEHTPVDAPLDPLDWGEPLHVDRYEGAWIRASITVLAIFVVAVLTSSAAFGIQLPGVYARIDPNTLLDEGNPFAEPGVRELAPGKYEVYIRAQIWSFLPSEIRVPQGATVTFYLTSQDVQHGFIVEGTNINMMVLPGQVSKLTATFDEPGTFNIICHEYCGIGHHNMFAQLIVE